MQNGPADGQAPAVLVLCVTDLQDAIEQSERARCTAEKTER